MNALFLTSREVKERQKIQGFIVMLKMLLLLTVFYKVKCIYIWHGIYRFKHVQKRMCETLNLKIIFVCLACQNCKECAHIESYSVPGTV